MIEFNDLYENPICPKCKSEMELTNDSIHTFYFDKETKQWIEGDEYVTNEYIQCPKCNFQREH